jgi:hypothetical protein
MQMNDGDTVSVEVRVGWKTLRVPCTFVVEPGRSGWVSEHDAVVSAIEREAQALAQEAEHGDP